VDIASLQTGNDAVEIHGAQLVGEPSLLRDRFPEINVETGVFSVLFELERHESRVGGHKQLLALCERLAGRQCQRQGYACGECFDHIRRHDVSYRFTRSCELCSPPVLVTTAEKGVS